MNDKQLIQDTHKLGRMPNMLNMNMAEAIRAMSCTHPWPLTSTSAVVAGLSGKERVVKIHVVRWTVANLHVMVRLDSGAGKRQEFTFWSGEDGTIHVD